MKIISNQSRERIKISNLVLPKGTEKRWVTYTKRRIGKNKNALYFFSGGTGSGKSWACLSFAEMLDDGFDISRVVFSAEELMEVLVNGNLKSGSVIIFEEVGVSLSHTAWQSQVNQLIGSLVQTFRHRNIILLMNSPFMHFMDKSTRILFHANMEMLSIDFNEKISKCKPKLITFNADKNKFYYLWLRYITKNDGIIPITRLTFPAPSKALLKQYESKKESFTSELNKSILSKLKELRMKGEKKQEVKPVKCLKCGFEWTPRPERGTIKQCPQCRKYPF